MIGEVLEQLGLRVDARIAVVDAVHVLGEQDGIRADFHGAQRGGGVRGEERVARAAGEDDDAALLQMAHSAAIGVGLAEAVHLHRGHDARGNLQPLNGVLHGDAVDGRAQHAHVVGVDGGHLRRGALTAAPDVARADDDGDLGAGLVQLADDGGHAVDLLEVEQAAVFAQRLTAELDEYALVFVHDGILLFVAGS